MMADEAPRIARIVRLFSTDIDGNMSIERAIRKVKGFKFAMSRAVCIAAGTDGRAKIGSLDSQQVRKLEESAKNYSFPEWMLNRRKDAETGKSSHIIGVEIDLRKREDINAMKKVKSYKGVRHELGLPVRGQRTRSSFRTQKTVGVSRKTAMAARAPAAAPKKKEEKK